MWEPCTSRTFAFALTPAPDVSTSSTHGPPALTSARALIVERSPLDVFSTVTCQIPSICRISTARERVRISAPRSAASRAVSTTRRASSTKQSEYSKPLRKRPDDVRRDLPEDFALDQRLANQPKLVIFQIAQAAMHELGRPGRRPAGQIIHFTQENRIAPARRIARDAAAIDASPNDSEVKNSVQKTLPRRSPIHFGDFAFDSE